MSNECWRRVVTKPRGCPHRSAGNGFCGGYGYEQTHFKFFKQQWSNNGPDGGPYSQILRRSRDKWPEKVKKEPPINTQSAQFQREQIKPALKQEYSTICSTEVPLTSQYLFGDELAKQLRHARESSKISHSVGHSSQQRPYTGNHRSVLECYNRLMEIFLWKGQHRSHIKKKPQINEKNHWPTVSNKRFGKWFSYISATPFKFFTWLLPQLQGGASRCSFCSMERSY